MNIQQLMNFLLISKDLDMEVFCLQKRITCLKITSINVRTIEGMGHFSHVVDTVLQQYENVFLSDSQSHKTEGLI